MNSASLPDPRPGRDRQQRQDGPILADPVERVDRQQPSSRVPEPSQVSKEEQERYRRAYLEARELAQKNRQRVRCAPCLGK